MKVFLIVLLAIILSFAIGLYGLGYFRFFAPKYQNIRREIFEETKSYIHGKIQDLAKYQDEYNSSDQNRKEAIRQLIVLRFAEFDKSKINSSELRKFLTNMRGY